MKIATVIGARPQFIKAATVSRVFAGNEKTNEILVHTGQHYDANMSDVFFDELEIPRPLYHLGIGGGSHGQQTGQMLAQIEEVFIKEKPNWVLVYGDTNSTLAGALAAAKIHIPVAHVEAGLRSFNRRMPEEVNRVLTDHTSDLLFSPTDTAVVNLQNEGIPEEKIHLVGDVMYDAALYFGDKADRQSTVLADLGLSPKDYVLSTIHRAENTDDELRLKSVFAAFVELSKSVPVVLPLHPRTRKSLEAVGLLNEIHSSLKLIDPVGFLDMVMLEKNARLIATDSGGVQKEAFFYRVPCVTLRDETEWVELVDLGWNHIVKPGDKDRVYDGILAAMDNAAGQEAFPYGRGDASKRIAGIISG